MNAQDPVERSAEAIRRAEAVYLEPPDEGPEDDAEDFRDHDAERDAARDRELGL